jgi:hypothetical protein
VTVNKRSLPIFQTLRSFPSAHELSKTLLSQPSHCISQLLFILAADFIERQSFNVPSHFYVHCSDHATTLPIVKTTKGFIFGGFAWLKWQNTDFHGLILEEKSHESFVFTLINPHGLRPDSEDYAILVCSNWGPSFGGNGFGFSNWRSM